MHFTNRLLLMQEVDINSTKYSPPKSKTWTGGKYEEGAPYLIIHGDCYRDPEFNPFHQLIRDEIKNWQSEYEKFIKANLTKKDEKRCIAAQALELLNVYINKHNLCLRGCVFSFSHEGKLISFTQYEKLDYLKRINILRCISAPEIVLSEKPKYRRANLAINVSIFHYAYSHGFQEITITPITTPSKTQARFLGFKPKESP